MLSIRCSQLSVTYAGDTRPSLDEVSVDIKPGEVVVFCGPSGSGKTTLLRCINGLVPRFYEGAFDGAVEIGGENIADWELHDIGRKVGSVFQDPRSQFFTTRGDAEIAFGCENLGMPPEAIRKRVDATLKGLRGEKLRDKSVFQMSSGERQKIAVGSARAMDLPVYTLDEPSANLDVEAAEQLTEILARFKAEGRTILLAEHRLHHLMPIIDRLIYLRNGRVEVELTADELKGLRPRQLRGIGLRQTDLTRLEPAVREPNERKGSSLRCSHLSFQYKKGSDQRRILNESRLIAHPGEIIALVGRNGAGKTTLARVLAGLEKEDEGYVFFDGQPLTPGERSEQTSLVLQDADYQLYRESVQEELKLGFKGQETPAERIQEIAEKLGLEDFLDRHPQSLSGGQKQRLTIGMAEVKDSPLVILDEPTSGLDVRSMQRICELVKSWAKSGRICVLISHDFEFLLETCTRVVAIDNGANIRDFPLERGRSLELLAILRGLASDSATKYRNIELHTRFRADRSQHEVLHNRRRRPMRYLEGDPIFVHLSKK